MIGVGGTLEGFLGGPQYFSRNEGAVKIFDEMKGVLLHQWHRVQLYHYNGYTISVCVILYIISLTLLLYFLFFFCHCISVDKDEVSILLAMFEANAKNEKMDRTKFRDILYKHFELTEDILMDRGQ